MEDEEDEDEDEIKKERKEKDVDEGESEEDEEEERLEGLPIGNKIEILKILRKSEQFSPRKCTNESKNVEKALVD